VSYFEWIKNITHMRFGRMERRFDEAKSALAVDILEEMVGKAVPEDHRNKMLHGANELDLVRSGLDDTMRLAYQEMVEAMRAQKEIPDLRTAAFFVAIEKIATAHQEMGL
jgi:glutamate dehydrogenase (NAD(P)+)